MEHDPRQGASQNAYGSVDAAGLESHPESRPESATTQDQATPPVSFRTPARSVVPLMSPVLIYAAIAAWRIDRIRSVPEASLGGIEFLAVILGAYLMFLMARFPLRVTVLQSAIDVQYALWRRHVPYVAIANVSLARGRDLSGRRIERIRIDLRNFIIFVLPNLQHGSLTLYDAIQAGWQKVHASSEAKRATPEPLTKLSMPYQPLSRADPSARHFPQWVTPVMLALAIAIALVAPRMIWRDLWGQSDLAPDTKALARFPQLATGWAGLPVPIFPRENLGGRWNVDYKTGTFTHSQTDFYIGDSIPVNVTRVFLNRESEGAFGAGTGISYDIHPGGDAVRFSYMFIVTPSGEDFHFTRISPGTSWVNAVFRADDIRGAGGNPFAGATISWNGRGWTLRMLDGNLMKFPGVHGQVSEGQAGLLSIEDGKGNLLRIDRDSRGNILKITSPHRAFITFKHDRYNRIISATDYLGKTILYDYDASEDLARVDDPRDGITHYVYDQGKLIKIIKPDGTTWLKVDYDDRGRVARMAFRDGSSCRYEYQTDSQGMVAAVDVMPSNGPPRHISLVGPMGG